MSWATPAGGSSSAGFTNTGIGYDGTNLLVGNFDAGIIVVCTTGGAYVSEIVLASSPASSVQGVAYDTSDGTYWVCHYAVSGGSLRHYNGSGTLLDTITLSGVGTAGPNGCCYDAVNDRVLTMWADNVVRGYSCATLSTTPVETITLTGITGTTADGICLDKDDPVNRIWVSLDGAAAEAPSYLEKINRGTGASVLANACQSGVEGIVYVGSDFYLCCDQGFHLSVTNGNRVWRMNPDTGEEITGTEFYTPKTAAITMSASAGTQIVTGLGFAPKAIIFFGAGSVAAATASDNFGAVDCHMNQWTSSAINLDAEAGSSKAYKNNDTGHVFTFEPAGSVTISAYVFTMTHDGFCFTVVTSGVQPVLRILALAGDGVSAKAGKFTMTTGAGSVAVTGVPFMPKAVLFSMGMSNTTEGAVTTETRMGIGAMTASAQWCASYLGTGGGTADEQGVGRTDAAFVRIANTLTTTGLAAYSSMDSGGFTVSKTTPPAGNISVFYLALGGTVRYAVGAFTQPNATTGNFAVTGTGFKPAAEFFVSPGRAANTTPTAHSRLMMGAAVSSSDRRSYVTSSEDAVLPTNTARDHDATACVIGISDGGTPTRLATADFVSQDTNGFTVNYTACDAVLRQNFYLAVGAAAPAIPSRFARQAVNRAGTY